MNQRCNGTECDGLKTQSSEEAMKCIKPRVVQEDFDGCKFFVFYYGMELIELILGVTDIPGMAMY